jgi:hypothetical protein
MQLIHGFLNVLGNAQTTPANIATNSMIGRLLVCTVLIIGVGHLNQSGGQVTMPFLTVTHAIKNSQQTHTTLHKMLGDTRYEALMDKKNDISIGKQLLKDNKAGLIAKHYKEQHKILTEKRQQGETLYIDFIDYY